MKLYPLAPIEKLLYTALVLLFLLNIGGLYVNYRTYQTTKQDSVERFHQLRNNQDQLLCITRGFVDPANYVQVNGITTTKPFIDKCIEGSK